MPIVVLNLQYTDPPVQLHSNVFKSWALSTYTPFPLTLHSIALM